MKGWPGKPPVHELSLAREIVRLTEAAAKTERFSCVTRIHLQLGALSCAQPEALDFAFAACRQGSLLGEAELDIARSPALGRCPDCGGTTEMWSRLDGCAHCHGTALLADGGDELRITELEVQ